MARDVLSYLRGYVPNPQTGSGCRVREDVLGDKHERTPRIRGLGEISTAFPSTWRGRVVFAGSQRVHGHLRTAVYAARTRGVSTARRLAAGPAPAATLAPRVTDSRQRRRRPLLGRRSARRGRVAGGRRFERVPRAVALRREHRGRRVADLSQRVDGARARRGLHESRGRRRASDLRRLPVDQPRSLIATARPRSSCAPTRAPTIRRTSGRRSTDRQFDRGTTPAPSEGTPVASALRSVALAGITW